MKTKVSILLSSVLLPLMMTAESFESKLYYSTDRALWADVNGDGVKESLVNMQFETADMPEIPEGAILVEGTPGAILGDGFGGSSKLCYLPFSIGAQYLSDDVRGNLRVEEGKYYCGLPSYMFEGMSDSDIAKICVAEYGSAPVTFAGSDKKYIEITDSNCDRLPLNGESSMSGPCSAVWYEGALYVDATSKFLSSSAGKTRKFDGMYFVDVKGNRVATVLEVELTYDDRRYEWTYPEGYNSWTYMYRNYFLVDIDNDGVPEVFTDDNSYYSDTTPMLLLKKGDDNVYRTVQTFSTRAFGSTSFVETDINLDGRPDYYFRGADEKHRVLLQRPDHTFSDIELAISTDEALISDNGFAASNTYVNKFSKPSGRACLTGMSGGEKGVAVNEFDNISLSVDVNLDGYPDLIDTKKGGAFLSVGDGVTYYAADFGGKVEVGDLNGDDIMDLLVFDPESGQVSVRMSSQNGYSEQNLVKNQSLDKMFVHDFDKDGDLDVLLTISYTGNYSFLIFYSNDGKGNLKKIENSYAGDYTFQECLDLNGDGTYSVTATGSESYFAFDVPSSMKPQPKTVLERDNTLGSFSNMVMLDYDNDGKTELFYYRNNGSKRWNIDEYSATANTAPAMSAAPSVLADHDKGFVKVEWKAATDRQSSAADLTYIVEVGNQKGDYSYGRVYAGRDNSALIRTSGWAPGEYYVSVRAIDGAGMTGANSAASTYNHVSPQPDFILGTNLVSVGKAVGVTLLSTYNPDWTYTYDGGDGCEVEPGDNGDCTLTFTSRGAKTVKLTVANGSDVTIATRDIEVYASGTLENVGDANGHRLASYADLDGDGVAEKLYTQLEANDGKGNFSVLGKMFNTNYLSLEMANVLDVNLDGKPDMMLSDKIFMNEGDLDFNEEAVKFTIIADDNSTTEVTSSDAAWKWDANYYDFDNDGRFDVLSWTHAADYSASYGIYRNLGNNTFKFIPFPAKVNQDFDKREVCDINNDGLLDLVCIGNNLAQSGVAVNKGGMTWEYHEINSDIKSGVYYTGLGFGGVEDVNNDGYADIVIKERFEGYTDIFWGDKSLTFEKSTRVDGVLETIGVDIDNDGAIDFIDTETNHLYFWNAAGNGFVIEKYSQDNKHGYDTKHFTGSSYRHDFDCQYADVNGDGTPDPQGRLRSTVKNEKPSVPAAVTAVPSGKGVLLSWTGSTDAETPAHQLKYNISLKKKGAEGADSYIISPMNCGNDNAAILPLVAGSMPRSTSIIVPLDRFDATTEYEVKVQAIDLWNASSPFSETCLFTVGSTVDIESPAVTGQGVATDFRYVGTEMTEQTWEWDGGNATLESGVYKVVWNTPGVKTIACTVGGKRAETSILVKERPALDIELPSKVLGGAPVAINLPEIFANAAGGAELIASEGVEISQIPGELQASVVFPSEAGRYFVGVDYTDDIFGTIGSQSLTEVIDFTPSISIVAVDGATGKNSIQWNPYQVPSETGLFTKMRIYKETGKTDNFELIGEVDAAEGNFVDMQSNPSVRKNRYAIALGTTYGGETERSTVHGSTHLMINKGLGNSLNLMWNAYEGGVVEQYTILRGTTPDNLEVLETLSGYENSFTDVAVPAGDCYYALSYESLVPQSRMGRAAGVSAHSNVVCSRDASEITFVEGLAIKSVEDDMKLDETSQRLHLYALVTPLRATFGDVQWRIAEGGDYATISTDGTVALTGKSFTGNIKVEAKSKDGSNVTTEIEIPVAYTASGIADEMIDGKTLQVVYDASIRSIKVSGVEHAVTVNIYSIRGNLAKSERISDDSFIALDLVPGIYVVNVEGISKKIMVK